MPLRALWINVVDEIQPFAREIRLDKRPCRILPNQAVQRHLQSQPCQVERLPCCRPADRLMKSTRLISKLREM